MVLTLPKANTAYTVSVAAYNVAGAGPWATAHVTTLPLKETHEDGFPLFTADHTRIYRPTEEHFDTILVYENPYPIVGNVPSPSSVEMFFFSLLLGWFL